MTTESCVGGVAMARPFKVRRLAHFGISCDADRVEEVRHFYSSTLGFRVSDYSELYIRFSPENKEKYARWATARGYLMTHNTDHHSFVLFPKQLFEVLIPTPPHVGVNQITWQVGSMREVADGIDWFHGRDLEVSRVGRDMPGSNWHMYFPDLDSNTNELCYGMEQVGWMGYSKPRDLWTTYRAHEAPELPIDPEYVEIERARAEGADLLSGWREVEQEPATYDVDGVLLARPFKVVRIGPVSLFSPDVDAAEAFYRDCVGLTTTEEAWYAGHRCVFMRTGTEHHSLALYPEALRDVFGLGTHDTLASFGMQLANYAQLRAAVEFLRERGVTVTELPTELHPGIDYAAYALDPEGRAVQLYFHMEQVGWDGRPRPAELRRPVPRGAWPEVLDALPDDYAGDIYFGPWA